MATIPLHFACFADDRIEYPAGPVWDPYTFQYFSPANCPHPGMHMGPQFTVPLGYWDKPLSLLPTGYLPGYPQQPVGFHLHQAAHPGSYPVGDQDASSYPQSGGYEYQPSVSGASAGGHHTGASPPPPYTPQPMYQGSTEQGPMQQGSTEAGPKDEEPVQPPQSLVPHIDEDAAVDTKLDDKPVTSSPAPVERDAGTIARKSVYQSSISSVSRLSSNEYCNDVFFSFQCALSTRSMRPPSASDRTRTASPTTRTPSAVIQRCPASFRTSYVSHLIVFRSAGASSLTSDVCSTRLS